jgi:hypothetical protein
MAYTSPTEKPWHHHISIDLLLKVGNVTILHPFVAWMIPLCLRAQATPWHHTSIRVSIAWATLLTVIDILGMINNRLAYGKAREVNLEDEVLVITGGARGLGNLIAEVYGMRGVSVAVLDVRDPEEPGDGRVMYYKCDVGDWRQVEKVATQIENDVCSLSLFVRLISSQIPLLPHPLLNPNVSLPGALTNRI